MSTAETLVKEYLDRGYSLEALRLVAESRQQPLGSEMLAVINAMEAEAEPVACETGKFSAIGDNMVFFVASDDETVAGDEGVDFDLMAATLAEGANESKADNEESVADILIGETDGSAVVPVKPPPALELADPVPAKSEGGIWNRIWSRVHRDASDQEERLAEAGGAMETAGGASGRETPSESEDGVPENGRPAAVAQAVDEIAGARGEVTSVAAAAQSDYIPGGAVVGENAEISSPDMVDEAKRRLAEAKEALAASPAEAVAGGDTLKIAESVGLSNAPDAGETDAKTSRRERRRRERAQKKKTKRSKKNAAENLPEIVLTRSEGTETLVPESDAQNDKPADVESSGGAGAKMTILTPLDMVDDIDASAAESAANDSGTAEPVAGDANDRGYAAAGEVGVAAEADAAAPEEMPAVNETGAEAAQETDGCAAAKAEGDAGESGADAGAGAAEAKVEAADAPVSEKNAAESDLYSGTEHLMIIASGGFDLAEVERSAQGAASSEADVGVEEASAEAGNNVILFRDKFPVISGGAEDMLDEDDDLPFHPVLRVLPPLDFAGDDAVASRDDAGVSQIPEVRDEPSAQAEPAAELESAPAAEAEPVESVESVVEPAAAPAAALEDMLSEQDRMCLLRALAGAPYADDESVAVRQGTEDDGGHCIMPMDVDAFGADSEIEREAAVRKEMEEEYQTRLDEFAARILQAQAATGERENRLREKDEELGRRDAALGELRSRLEEEEKKQQALERKLDAARREAGAKQAELERMGGLQDEHRNLYDEFEDLRRAYNEVVTDVMPELQNERDDLALTVERQCEKEKSLRDVITSSRRRLAASYVLGAAACLMLIALPVANWMKAGVENKELAVEHQMVSELRENHKAVVEENIRFKNELVELERKMNRARMDLAELQQKNQELNQMAMANSRGISAFGPVDSGDGGTPTRMSTMALQAAPQSDGRLRTNEVRDPAGSIESLFAHNRAQNDRDDSQMALSRQPSGPVMLNSVARGPERRNGLRPEPADNAPARVQPRSAGLRPGAGASTPTRAGGTAPRQGEVLAKVKRGEGVAQVVYRVLGTWDPEVVSWVIRENNIRTDRRGNPVIQPDQELRLPKEGRMVQAASAERRR